MDENFHDLPLSEQLTLTRQGTAHYSGQIAQLSSEDFDEPTLLPGWSRKHLIAHVAYNAAALCNLMHWAETGERTPMYSSPEARLREIEFGATLDPDPLRNLHAHTVARLDAAWQEATSEAWQYQVETAQGRSVPASETLWMRTREVWIHAVDLGLKASFEEIPSIILKSLLEDITSKWRSSGVGVGLTLVDPADQLEVTVLSSSEEPETIISGGLSGLVRWASGRGAEGVTALDRESVPSPPRWL
ncbi:maleylpyruvate isomerase family mycothiol-dependent enzyme [Corynebacterium sp. 3HC-13]|uniref:maleylpyruvate isomerase family mycothiol-dependent enzyme n=1 Tax=Corynebacterium poyangense TaxID=2684405 RepID=UPI001CCA7F50|nr:maleylpyruvate isomerase family mycothiol-dependent enzyme [Corynebacterium poyangense]MBZ8176636.1 maleylpyruvate isomerase family mycothiol-dependent enzyme [Corynebacterium poyangense]